MKSRHFSTIRSKIFIPYISILTVVILLTSAAYYFLSYNTFVKNYTRNSIQHTQIVSRQITDYLEDLNSQQKRIIDSEAIRLYIFEQASGQSPPRNVYFMIICIISQATTSISTISTFSIWMTKA